VKLRPNDWTLKNNLEWSSSMLWSLEMYKRKIVTRVVGEQIWKRSTMRTSELLLSVIAFGWSLLLNVSIWELNCYRWEGNHWKDKGVEICALCNTDFLDFCSLPDLIPIELSLVKYNLQNETCTKCNFPLAEWNKIRENIFLMHQWGLEIGHVTLGSQPGMANSGIWEK